MNTSHRQVLNGMRVIKMYGWQVPFSKLVSDIRALEMGRITFTNMLRALNMAFFFSAPAITAFLTLAPYALSGNEVTPEDVRHGRDRSRPTWPRRARLSSSDANPRLL